MNTFSLSTIKLFLLQNIKYYLFFIIVTIFLNSNLPSFLKHGIPAFLLIIYFLRNHKVTMRYLKVLFNIACYIKKALSIERFQK